MTSDGMKIKRVSRWIQIHCDYVSPRHELYGYSDDGSLLYFKFDGRRYALGEFMRFSWGPITFDENGEQKTLAGYDSAEYYYPLLIEISESGEYVRLYKECKEVA